MTLETSLKKNNLQTSKPNTRWQEYAKHVYLQLHILQTQLSVVNGTFLMGCEFMYTQICYCSFNVSLVYINFLLGIYLPGIRLGFKSLLHEHSVFRI